MMRCSELCASAMRASAWRRWSMSIIAKVISRRPSSPWVATALPTIQKVRPSQAWTWHSNCTASPSRSVSNSATVRRKG